MLQVLHVFALFCLLLVCMEDAIALGVSRTAIAGQVGVRGGLHTRLASYSVMTRAAFTDLLTTGAIICPHTAILDTVECFFTARMVACSSLQMTEGVYRAAQAIPGVPTAKDFMVQHGLAVPNLHWWHASGTCSLPFKPAVLCINYVSHLR